MITRAIDRAYRIAEERNQEFIYWAIDLHGVVLKSNYEQGGYQFINEYARRALRLLSFYYRHKIIIWSSCYPEEQQRILDFLKFNGIEADYFNENPECPDTKSGCFSQKFYFSILLDDKAGFDPNVHWDDIIDYLISQEGY